MATEKHLTGPDIILVTGFLTNILLIICSLPTHGFSCLPEIINYISMNEKEK